MSSIPISRLHDVFTLDADTGKLFWKIKIANKIVVGSPAGWSRKDGYQQVQVDKERALVHHVVFAMTNGYWPKEIDHINGNPADNRICNLREASRTENNYNRVIASNNTSGYKGVFKQARGVTWSVRLKCKKVLRRVGGFKTKELAKEFLDLWRDMAHHNFAYDGTPR